MLEPARSSYRAGDTAGALRACAHVLEVARVGHDADLTVAAATLVRRPTDALARAQAHVLAAAALAAVRGRPDLAARALAQWKATRNPFHADPDPDPSRWPDPEGAFLELQARVDGLRAPEHAEQALELAADTAALGIAKGSIDHECWGRSWAMDAHAVLGNRAELLHELAALTALSPSSMPWPAHMLLVRASQAQLEGRFPDALSLAAEARELGGDAVFLDLVFQSSVACATGENLERVSAQVRRVVADLPFPARGWLCAVLVADGAREEAAVLWEALRPYALLPSDSAEFLIGMISHTEICVRLGDAETAEVLYACLLPYAGRHAIAHAHTPYEGPVDLALGRLARLTGHVQAARTHLQAALADCRRIQARAHEALVLAELADLDHPRSRSRHEHAATAVALAASLGMKPLTARAQSLLRSGGGLGTPLSRREEEVASLVAEGLSNAAIAARLHLSERTVESHVSRIMLKIDVGSRTAVAAWQARRVT
jgi:DNA-binding NarL/FixJ family response regulator